MDDKLKNILKAIEENDREKEMFLTKDYNPFSGRDAYAKILGNTALDYKSIKNPEDFKTLFNTNEKVMNTDIIPKAKNELKGAFEMYYPNSNKMLFDKTRNEVDSASDIIHGLGHARDYNDMSKTGNYLNDIGELADKTNKNVNYDKLKGLSNIEKFWENHHMMEDFFEREAIQKLLKGGKLAIAGAAPVLKGLGAAGTALGLASIANKAYAGDYADATKEGADLASDYIAPELILPKMAIKNAYGMIQDDKNSSYVRDPLKEGDENFQKINAMLKNRN